MSSKYYTGQEHLKKRSRDAARSRRGQQNDEYSELAHQLPLSEKDAMQLDRLSVMRLANNFIKIKHFLQSITDKDAVSYRIKQEYEHNMDIENELLLALDGFVFVIGPGGHCLYISNNVTTYLGLLPVEVMGNSFYKFIHPCDHEEVAKELGGKIPLEDMEIFDGLFCSDSVFLMANNLKGGSVNSGDQGAQPYRSFFVRMKSTLTSRGKSVNLKASTYRVVHCMGSLQAFPMSQTRNGNDKTKMLSFVGIGVPLMFTPTFEVPLDCCTFTSHHALDLKFIYCEEGIEDILGYPPSFVIGRSLYDINHGSDSDILINCHKTLLTKGQSVSGYYRLLACCGGWIWVQTKASIVYASKSCQPQFVLCVHYAISGVQEDDCVVSLDQLRSLTERQDSPGNSPQNDTLARKYYKKLYERRPVDLEKVSRNLRDIQNHDNQDRDNHDVAMEEDENTESESKCSSVIHSERESPVQEKSFYPTFHERCAPFIPPPVVDAPFLANCAEMLTADEEMENIWWNTGHWEIHETPNRFKKPAQPRIARNLSTPKFYPVVDDLPVLKSDEIDELLQGNEIWLSIDHNRQIMT